MSSVIRGDDGFDSLVHQGIGVNQTWQNVTGSRALATNYTNSTGKPIQVSVTTTSTVGNAQAYLTVNSITVSTFKNNDYYTASSVTPHAVTISAIIPDGATYQLNQSGSGTTITAWVELR